MRDDGFKLGDALAVLERTPASLRALLAGLPETWARATEGEGTWSPYDVVGHLIHGERADWVPRAEIILAQGAQRRFTPFDRFAQFRESEGKSLAAPLFCLSVTPSAAKARFAARATRAAVERTGPASSSGSSYRSRTWRRGTTRAWPGPSANGLSTTSTSGVSATTHPHASPAATRHAQHGSQKLVS